MENGRVFKRLGSHAKIFLYFLFSLTDTNHMETTLFEGQKLTVGSALFTVLAVKDSIVTMSRQLMTGQVVTTSYRVRG